MKIIETNLPLNQIQRYSRTLYSLYNPFEFDDQIWENIKEVFPSRIYNQLQPYRKSIVGHAIINELIMKYFTGEITIKFNFIKNYLNKQNEVTIFELKINSSRVDISRINNKSIAYEIKTELDTLDKLDKQIADYSKVFELIYVIIHPSHFKKVSELIPPHCGVITYNLKNGICKFSFKKKALQNKNIDSNAQISTLSNRELDLILKTSKIHILETDRKMKEKIIFENFTDKKINTLYKKVLKVKYNSNWNHLCKHFEEIMPVDVQSFYSTKADPHWIYYKNSSIV